MRTAVAFLAIGWAALCPAAEFRVVESFTVTPAPACMPALTRAPNGDLLVAFSTEWEPFPWGGILKLVRSTDEGRTWSEPVVLWQDEDPRVTIQVSNGLQTLSNGEVLLPVTYCLVPKHERIPESPQRWGDVYNPSDPGYRREVRLLRSRDSGRTWTVEDPKLDKPWWRFGRLLETKDGRLIMPGSGFYIESRDFGKTWGPKIDLHPAYRSETNIVEAADGRLFSILRQKGEYLGIVRHFASNISRDGGKTWGDWHWTGVQGKMPDLLVRPSGRILMSVGLEGLEDGIEVAMYPDRHSFATLFISIDHGQSWLRDVEFAQVDKGSAIVPADSPVMCPLRNGQILVVIQGFDRHFERRIDGGPDLGKPLIANIIEPVDPRFRFSDEKRTGP